MLTMIRRLGQILRSTSKIDPGEYSMTTSDGRLASFGYAIAGCLYMLRYQKNTRIQLAATIVVIAAALWLGIKAEQWAILTLTIASVWISEFINAAVEASVNLSAQTYHPMAKVAKDVAAGAVLIASAAAFIIGVMILGPPLMEKLQTLN